MARKFGIHIKFFPFCLTGPTEQIEEDWPVLVGEIWSERFASGLFL